MDVAGKDGGLALEVVGASDTASKDDKNSSQCSGAMEDIVIKKPAEYEQQKESGTPKNGSRRCDARYNGSHQTGAALHNNFAEHCCGHARPDNRQLFTIACC